jgi:hypothetical protein
METLKMLLVLTCIIGIGVLSLSGVADLGRGFPNPYYVDGRLIFWGALKLLRAFVLISSTGFGFGTTIPYSLSRVRDCDTQGVKMLGDAAEFATLTLPGCSIYANGGILEGMKPQPPAPTLEQLRRGIPSCGVVCERCLYIVGKGLAEPDDIALGARQQQQ